MKIVNLVNLVNLVLVFGHRVVFKGCNVIRFTSFTSFTTLSTK